MHQGFAVFACWLGLSNMASGCIRRLSYWQDLPLLAVEGCNNHFTLGLVQGTTFGGLIRARVADSDVLATVQEYIDTPRGREVFNVMRALHMAAYPFYWQELNGLAAGSNLPLETVFALNLRNELLAASRLDPQQAASTPQQQQQQGQGMEEAVMKAKDKQNPQEQELQWVQHLLRDAQPGKQDLQEEQEQQQEQQQWHQQALQTEQRQQRPHSHTAHGQQHSVGRQVSDNLPGNTGEGCSDILVTLVDTDPPSSSLPVGGGLPSALPSKATMGHETATAVSSMNQARKLTGGSERRLSSSKATVTTLSPSLSGLAQHWSLSWPVAVMSCMWRWATGLLSRTAGWGGAAGCNGSSGGADPGVGPSPTQQPGEEAVGAARRNQDSVTSFLGHNEDVSSDVVGRMYLLKVQMVGHPTFVALVYPGELPSTAFGINSAGIAFTLDALYPLQPVLPAIGRNWLSRAMLDATDMGAAESLLNMDLQATGRCINLLDMRTCALSNTEIAPGGNASTLRVGVGSGSWEFHANMYQRMDVPEQPGQSSVHRQAVARKYPAPESVDDILELLGDESDATWPIYRTGASSKDSAFTAFTILITASCTGDMVGLSSRVHILQGNPREKNVLLTLDGRTLMPLTAATKEVAPSLQQDIVLPG